MKMVKINFEVQKKTMYWILAFVLVLASAVTVYALTAGTAPNPGHTLNTISAPSGCGENTFIKWTGSEWSCVDVSTSSEFDGNLDGNLIVSGVITAPTGHNVIIKLPAQ